METTEPHQEKPSTRLQRIQNYISKFKGEIGLSILMLYIFLLGLGTVGEVWNIQWILDLPIFRPPGKY